MALPTSRDITAVDGGPLPASVINNIQDQIINGFHHGDVTVAVPLPVIYGDAGGAYSGDTPGWSGDVQSTGIAAWHSGVAVANNRMSAVLPLRIGDRLKQVDLYLHDNAGGIQIELQASKLVLTGVAPGTISILGSGTAVSGNSANVAKISVTFVTPELVVVDAVYRAQMYITNSFNPSVRFFALFMTYDHP